MYRIQCNISTPTPRAYTLVELIVVIAILVVLSTVGFVGYSQYSITSRDGARASDLKAIYEGLKIVQAQKWKAPAPDEALTINNSSGALHALQGVIGESVRTAMNLESGGRDPQTGKPYTYYLFRDKKHFQLLGMFEQDGFQEKFAWDSPLTPTAYAETADLTPVTIGTKLWVVLDTDTETPINEVLTGSTTLSSLAASGATVVGSPIVGTGSSVVMTPSMVVALSSPLTTSGALVAAAVPLQEQLFGASSTYTTGWSSNPCDPNAMTVVEVDAGNYTTYFPASLATNTIYVMAPTDYPIAVWTNISLPTCSAIVSASSSSKARIWSGHPTNYSSSWNGSASPVCGYNFITTWNNTIIDRVSFKFGAQSGAWLPVGLCAGSNSTYRDADFELSAAMIPDPFYGSFAIVGGTNPGNSFINVTNNGAAYTP